MRRLVFHLYCPSRRLSPFELTMGVVKYSTALLVSYLVIVLSLSIPVVQPIAGSDNHSAVDLPAG